MIDNDAPHGRDDNGVPLAPYGLTVDGRPRKSNRGAKPGQKGNQAGKPQPAAALRPGSDDARRHAMLVELADVLLVTPLAGASATPFIRKRLGEKHAGALAIDALAFDAYAPHLAQGAIILSHSKPGVLAWMDTVEEKAPWLLLAQATIGLGRAIIQNHLDPDPVLVAAGRRLGAEKVAARMAAIKAEAEAAEAAYAEAA